MASFITYTKAKLDTLLAAKLSTADINQSLLPADFAANGTNGQVLGIVNGALAWVTPSAGTSSGGSSSGGGSATPSTTLITNGDFSNYDVGWTGIYGGRSAASQKLVFTNSGTFDPVYQAISLTASKYYEVAYTITNYSAGDFYAQLSGGGTAAQGVKRTTNGTFTERILANTGNADIEFLCSVAATLTVDNIVVTGPFNTSTVGGS